jgi:hypothetical protein
VDSDVAAGLGDPVELRRTTGSFSRDAATSVNWAARVAGKTRQCVPAGLLRSASSVLKSPCRAASVDSSRHIQTNMVRGSYRP